MTALLQVSGYVRRQSAKSDEKRPRFTPDQITTASKIQTEIDASFVLAVEVALAQEFPGELK
ncbi:hypothetical protein ACNSPG_06485 [Brucella pituitosa]|uniref:hypothetical protein n=1 Tax=Brucella pituitosa TaxID=571256 RepID=UPI003C741C2D